MNAPSTVRRNDPPEKAGKVDRWMEKAKITTEIKEAAAEVAAKLSSAMRSWA